MYLKFGDEFHDYDQEFLRNLLALLDTQLDERQVSIDLCVDPDQMGLLDGVEYIAGMGFVACQRYIASTYGHLSLSSSTVLDLSLVYVQWS
jgi:hypothetical protein